MVLRCPPRSKREGDILPLLQHAFRDAPATWRGATVEGCPANAEARVNRPTRNYAYLVFDTLYGLDTNWMAQPQMVQGHEIAKDGLVWTLKLREGLRVPRQGAGAGPRRGRQHSALRTADQF